MARVAISKFETDSSKRKRYVIFCCVYRVNARLQPTDWSSKAGIRRLRWLSTADWPRWFRIDRHRRRRLRRSWDPSHRVSFVVRWPHFAGFWLTADCLSETSFLCCFFYTIGLQEGHLVCERICTGDLHKFFERPVHRADSGVVRIDLLRFLAGCRKRQLNQALSVLCLSIVFKCVFCCLLGPLFVLC